MQCSHAFALVLTCTVVQSHHLLPTLPLSLRMPNTSALLVLKPQILSMGSAIIIQSNPRMSYMSSTMRTSQGSYIGAVGSWYIESASEDERISGGGGMTSGLVFTFAGRALRRGRARAVIGAGDGAAGDPENRPNASLSEVGELEADDEALDSMLSSLILVCRTTGLRALMTCSAAPRASYLGSGFEIALVDFEYGESSMGVTEMRDEGESKDCERWIRILGDGVRSGAANRAGAAIVSPSNAVLYIPMRCRPAAVVGAMESTAHAHGAPRFCLPGEAMPKSINITRKQRLEFKLGGSTD